MFGIYSININNKFYIGSSVDILQRIKKHRRELRGEYHHNINLQRAWNKYGDFSFSIILLCEEFELERYEQWFFDNVVRWGFDYNISKDVHSFMRGKKFSNEHRKKLSNNHADVSGSNHPFYGKELSIEHKDNISRGNIGKKIGEDNGKSKLKVLEVMIIRELYLTKKYSQRKLADMFDIGHSTVFQIVNYKTWRYI